jgi:NAD(P)-dependent dehydrogenase (short-subunit alcohol dehydrogenase family)
MSLQRKTLKPLSGRSIVVTGAASGLGEATARYLAEQGAKVTLLDMDDAKGPAVAEACGGKFVKTNVTDEASVKAAIDVAKSSFGTIHGVVNCAGIAPPSKVLGKKGVHPQSLFEKVLMVNVAGSFNVARLAAEVMAQNQVADGEDRGVIVNTASIAAFDGQIGQAAYASSKGAVVAMTLPMARELAAHNIRVNTICPGIFLTPMMASLPKSAQESLAEAVPFPRRLGNSFEFAALVSHILCNQYLNGETIRLDGSLRMAAM